MKIRQWIAVIMAVTIAVSGCLPVSGIAALAAETDAEITQETKEVTAEEEDADVTEDAEAESAGAADDAVAENDVSTEDAENVETAEETTEETEEAEAVTEEEQITENEAEAATEEAEAATEETEEADAAEEEAEATAEDEETTAEAADAAAEEEETEETEEADLESYQPEDDTSTDDLFSDYVDKVFGISSGISDSPKLYAKRATAGSRLTDSSLGVYNYIGGQLPLIASGERTSTVFTVAVTELGMDQIKWTKDELGVETIKLYDEDGNAYLSDEAKAAVAVKMNFDLDKLVDALLADYPYLLYWFDKTAQTTASLYKMSYTSSYVRVTGSITVNCPVAGEYATDTYVVDSSIGQTVQASAANAAAVVEAHASEDDYEKLTSYLEEICSMTSYNYNAIFTGADYGNPWQLIWVFDDDATTKVVCEGYSKAFKYLCDMSTFEDDIGCLLITGAMATGSSSGGHMWNVVSMGDDYNYLVDVTNCDSGSIGSPDLLFLAGAEGSVDDGFTAYISSDSYILYTYDSDAKGLWTTEELTLRDEDYDPCWKYYSDWEVVTEATYLTEGLRRKTCSDCGKVVEEVIPILTPTAVEDLDIAGITDLTYTGEALTQDMTISDGDEVLTEGVHYTVEYSNNINATEETPDTPATVTITGILENGYDGSVTKEFAIAKAANKVTAKSFSKVYSVNKRTYSISAEITGGDVTWSSSNSKVTVSDEGRVTIPAKFMGKTTITITAGDSNYKTAVRKIVIRVNPTMTAIRGLTSTVAGKMTIKWNKNAIGTGYQIQFATLKDFSNAKSARITSKSTVTKTIGGLVKGQKYYVRMRTYKTVDGVNFYSAWCAIKAVRIIK